jgi:hypothetical protein
MIPGVTVTPVTPQAAEGAVPDADAAFRALLAPLRSLDATDVAPVLVFVPPCDGLPA